MIAGFTPKPAIKFPVIYDQMSQEKAKILLTSNLIDLHISKVPTQPMHQLDTIPTFLPLLSAIHPNRKNPTNDPKNTELSTKPTKYSLSQIKLYS